MNKLSSVCVYCGAAEGSDPVYRQAAEALGRTVATAGIRLVYGGGSIGLMGAVALSALDHGGAVTGIIPEFLVNREVMLHDVQELIVTADMHERKRLMFERSDAFIALPGGIGTLEETVEMLTWSQLGQHQKPVCLVNVAGFWDPLCRLIEHMREQAFIRQSFEVSFLTVDSVEAVLPAIEQALAQRPPELAPDPESDREITRRM